MSDKAEHEPWTPWSIWHNAELPDMAFERLAAGGIWRIQEPMPDPFKFEVDPRRVYEKNDVTLRIAVYKLGRAMGYGSAKVLGQWEGDKDWVEVGWIEGG